MTEAQRDELRRSAWRLRRAGKGIEDATAALLTLHDAEPVEVVAIVGAVFKHEDDSNTLSQLDTRNARLLVRALDARHRCVVNEKGDRWLVWDGNRWRDDDGEIELLHAIDEFARVLSLPPHSDDRRASARRLSTSAGKRAAIYSLRPDMAIDPEALDSRPDVLSLAFGTLTLRGRNKGAVRDPRPDDWLTRGLDVSYRPDASDDAWQEFGRSIFPNDPARWRYVNEMLAWHGLHGHAGRRALVLHGPTHSGKSTLVEAATRVLGELGKGGRLRVLYVHDGGGPDSGFASMFGPRMMYLSEGDGQPLDAGKLKPYLGGVPTEYEEKYRRARTSAMPTALLLLDTNYMPALDGGDAALFKRLEVVEFDRRFYDRRNDRERRQYEEAKAAGDNPGWCDPNLGDRLATKAAQDGILRHLIDVLRDLDGEPVPPPTVTGATASWKDASDPLAAFIESCCDRGSEHVAPYAEFLARLNAYTSEHHEHARRWSAKRLTADLTRAPWRCRVEKATSAGIVERGARVVVGLSLKPEPTR